MKKLIFVLPIAFLAACSATQVATVATAVQDACKDAQATLGNVQGQVGGGASNTVASLAGYVAKACPIINGAVTVAANVAADPSSAEWLGTLTGQLQAAAAVKPAAS